MKLKKHGDLLLIAAFAILVAFPVAINMAHHLGVSFPSFMGVGRATSSLEGRMLQEKPSFSVAAFSKGDYQSQCDKFLSDSVPMRDQIVSSHARLQREIITCSNALFGFDAIPTKFGSDYVVVPGHNAVLPNSVLPNEKNTLTANQLADILREAAEAHPNTVFIYDILTDVYSSDVNPTHKYLSNSYNEDWLQDNIISRLGNNVRVMREGIADEQELYTDWFLTEPHWRLNRILQSYSMLGSELGWKEVKYSEDFLAIDAWRGSSARGGLIMDYSDDLRDLPTDFSSLTCVVGGKKIDRGNRDKMMRGEKVELDLLNGYHSYYGTNYPEIVYANPEDQSGKTCLIVQQSFGVPLEPYIASNYKITVCVAPLNVTVNKSLDQLIEQYRPDDVVVLLGYTYLSLGKDRSPVFFP